MLSGATAIVYAGFAFIVAALLWTYFGWLILLAGTQLSFYIQNPSYLRIGLQELRLSSTEIEQLALRVMFLVGRTHVTGGPRWIINRLASELGLPGIAVAQIGAALEKAGLLIVTEDDEFVPGRDIGRIRSAGDSRSGAQSAQRPLRAEGHRHSGGGSPEREAGRCLAPVLRGPHAAGSDR